MRILAVTSSYPKFDGDVTAPFIESITRGLASRGHVLDVVLPEHPEWCRPHEPRLTFQPFRYAPRPEWCLWGYAQSLEADVRVRRGMWMLAPLVAVGQRRQVAGLLESRRYDAGLLHWLVPNAVLVADLIRRHRVPYVVSLHGSDVFVAERVRFLRGWARRTLSGAGAITACSGDLHTRVLGLGAAADRTETIPYGVDLARFAPRPSQEVRERWGVPPVHLLVAEIGRLVEKKGFRYLVEAAARVGRIVVVLAGDGDLRTDLEARAKASGAPVRLAGSLDRASVEALLGAADVAVVPSVVDQAGNVDGLPNSLLEALAAGKAVVASRVAGIPEVVDDGENGLLVPGGEVDALTEALERLVADAELRARLGAQARRRAEQELGWATIVERYEASLVRAQALAAR